jgi:hypothetical protein
LRWAINCSLILSLRMICSAVCLLRVMVESPVQPGRLMRHIHPEPASDVHVSVDQVDCKGQPVPSHEILPPMQLRA